MDNRHFGGPRPLPGCRPSFGDLEFSAAEINELLKRLIKMQDVKGLVSGVNIVNIENHELLQPGNLTLEDLGAARLANMNDVFVPWQGSAYDTRNYLPALLRRKGISISYVTDKGVAVKERAVSDVGIDNANWGLDSNWMRVDELSMNGELRVSPNGTWVINGVDSGIQALGPKGDNGLTPRLKTIDNKLHYSYDGKEWLDAGGEHIAAWFRWSGNKIQISRDNKTWEDFSGEFADNLFIKGYVATFDQLPADAVQGDIWGVGPRYAAEDTENTNPIYRYWVRNADGWVDNGEFTSIAAGIVQETGDGEGVVMSQKAVSEKFTDVKAEIYQKVSESPGVNLVNPNAIKDEYGLGTNFQEYKLGAGFCISNYIKANGNNIVANSFNRAGYASFVVYDQNYNPIRSIENNSQYLYQDGDYYVRITFNHESKVTKLFANYGETILPYAEYVAIGGYVTEKLEDSDSPIATKKVKEIVNGAIYEIGNSKNPTAYKTGIIQAACALYIVPNNGILETIEVYCNSDSCIDLVTYTRNTGGSWNVETYLATIKCSKGLNKIQIDSPVKKGHYIGFNITDATSSIGYTTDGSSGELGSGALKLKGKYITMNGTANNYCIKCTIKADEISKGVQQLHHSTALIDSAYNTTDNFISSGFVGFDATQNNALVYFNKKSWIDKYVHHVEFILNKPDDTKIVLCQPSGDARNSGGYYVSLDTSANTLNIHSNWNGNIEAEPPVLESVNIPFVIGNNNTYVLDVIVDSVKTLTAKFTNKFTQESVEISDITTGDAHYHGNGVYCGVLLKYGHINIKRFKISADCPVRPTLTIYGDSFCQGYNLLRGGEDIALRYPQLIMNYLDGNATIICKGGRTSEDMEEIMESDMNLIVGKYTLLAIGLNNNIVSNMSLDDFKVSISKLINKVRRSGSEPILVTYPRLGNDSLSEQYNSWITTYIPMKYLDVREATAVKEGAYGTIDQSLYLEDGHPNAAGNEKIFKRFVMDFADMKSDNFVK